AGAVQLAVVAERVPGEPLPGVGRVERRVVVDADVVAADQVVVGAAGEEHAEEAVADHVVLDGDVVRVAARQVRRVVGAAQLDAQLLIAALPELSVSRRRSRYLPSSVPW